MTTTNNPATMDDDDEEPLVPEACPRLRWLRQDLTRLISNSAITDVAFERCFSTHFDRPRIRPYDGGPASLVRHDHPEDL